MRVIRSWLIVLIAVAAILTPAPAQAQTTPIQLDALEIDLWGEYDQPSMLVIYRLMLAADTPMPATLTLRIPSAVGTPYNVAYRDTDNQLYSLTYTREVQGDWTLITFTTITKQVQFEYYDPALTKNGKERSYSFEWQGDYAIKKLSIQVQQPVGASQMNITPALGSGSTGEGNMIYYNANVGEVTAGQKFKIALSYQKENDQLSMPALPLEPEGPVSNQTAGRSPDMNTVLAWVLGSLGVLLLVGGGVWYWQTSKAGGAASRGHRHASRREKPAAVVESSGEGSIFCHQCGKRAGPGDVFCRACGTRLRTS